MNGANVLEDRKNGYVNEDDRALLKVCNAVLACRKWLFCSLPISFSGNLRLSCL